MYLMGSIHNGTLLHYEIQYTAVNYNQQRSEHDQAL
jgi:hypothetical protein